jgi:hypothetical protein
LGEIFDEDDFSEADADTLIDFVDMLDAQEAIRNPEPDETQRGLDDLRQVGTR